jgi:hypothetical protein
VHALLLAKPVGLKKSKWCGDTTFTHSVVHY